MSQLAMFAAIAVSLAMTLALRHSDPKRRRVARLPVSGVGSGKRAAIVLVLLAPGATLAFQGDSAAFLIWLGSCAVGGWLVAQLPAPNAAKRR